MTDDLIKLARRAVACKGWRWMPGMKGEYPAESVAVRVHGVGVTFDPYCDAFALHSCRRFNIPVSRLHDPDLTDAATVGCLLALVREAYPDAYTVPQFGGGWEVASPVDADVVGDGLSEAEALVAALEAAP